MQTGIKQWWFHCTVNSNTFFNAYVRQLPILVNRWHCYIIHALRCCDCNCLVVAVCPLLDTVFSVIFCAGRHFGSVFV